MKKEYNELMNLLDQKKALDIKYYDVSKTSPFNDLVIIATVSNSRQLEALANEIEDFLEVNKLPVHHIEGTKESGWMIIDAYDVLVHLFTSSERERVKLDTLLENNHK